MIKHLRGSIVSVLLFTLLCGFLFPLIITVIAQAAFHHQANGSLIVQNGNVVGSELIGQSFAAPGYFHPRPSAAGSGYDATASGGTNLGPTSDKLINGVHKKLPDGKDDPNNFDGIKDLAAAYRKENGLPDRASIPADAVTRSASGLDPEISPANAALQIARIAKTRGLPPEQVQDIALNSTRQRQLGLLGEPGVNVLRANLALDRAAPNRSGAPPGGK